MALLALVSAGGAAGVTTSALALGLTWAAPVLVAECDTDGGSVLPGTFGGHVPADRGLLQLALLMEEDPARAAAALWRGEMTVPLGADGTCPVLTGLRDPF